MSEDKIRLLIENHGYVTLAEYMQISAYDYYSKADGIGEKGDFITAPEISQLFGEMIGAWLAFLWSSNHKLKNANVIELGPGNGTLMYDIIRSTKNVPMFHQSVKFCLVENSPQLQEEQRKKLAEFDNIKIEWYSSVDQIDEAPMLIIANEFFDALPIHQYVLKDDIWFETIIKTETKKKNLEYGHIKVNHVMSHKLETEYPFAKEGACIEISPTSESITDYICERLSKEGGVMTIIDYGFFVKPNKRKDFSPTLQSILNHKAVDPLRFPGEADITAHVDFYNLALVANAHGAEVFYNNQADFLNSLGIKQRADVLIKNANEKQKFQIKTALNRLISPSAMGELFKVLVISMDLRNE